MMVSDYELKINEQMLLGFARVKMKMAISAKILLLNVLWKARIERVLFNLK